MNLFNFEYQENRIQNLDGTTSRFGVVYGRGGKVIHTKKDSYTLVSTQSMSNLGQTFIDKGHEVSTFVKREGEVIGLNITLSSNRKTKVGDKSYNALITVPNNGGGKGYLALKEERLICTNGWVKNNLKHKEVNVKIPHTLSYQHSVDLMEQSLLSFRDLAKELEAQDAAMVKKVMSRADIMRRLNEWYFKIEMPKSHREGLTLDEFRKIAAMNPETLQGFHRYKALREAFELEMGYNQQLELEPSLYTVFSAITNYLSRRVEESKSSAPEEVQYSRAAKKLESIIEMV